MRLVVSVNCCCRDGCRRLGRRRLRGRTVGVFRLRPYAAFILRRPHISAGLEGRSGKAPAFLRAGVSVEAASRRLRIRRARARGSSQSPRPLSSASPHARCAAVWISLSALNATRTKTRAWRLRTGAGASSIGAPTFRPVALLLVCVAAGISIVAIGGIALVDAVVLPGSANVLAQRREARKKLVRRRFGGVRRALRIRSVGEGVHSSSPRQTARSGARATHPANGGSRRRSY